MLEWENWLIFQQHFQLISEKIENISQKLLIINRFCYILFPLVLSIILKPFSQKLFKCDRYSVISFKGKEVTLFKNDLRMIWEKRINEYLIWKLISNSITLPIHEKSDNNSINNFLFKKNHLQDLILERNCQKLLKICDFSYQKLILKSIKNSMS